MTTLSIVLRAVGETLLIGGLLMFMMGRYDRCIEMRLSCMSDYGPCDNCGAEGEPIIPVWEDEVSQLFGLDPDYLGCTSCGQMDEYEDCS